MALLFEAVVPAHTKLAQNGACNMFWLQMNNLSNQHMKISIRILGPADPDDNPDNQPDDDELHESEVDYLPRGFV